VRYEARVRAATRGLGPVVALALLAAGCSEKRPNLLLISIDTLRPDRLECYGGPAGSGSKLCGLFRDGTRYAWAFTTAPYTAPAMSSVLTSLYPAYHGVTQSSISYLGDEHQTLAESLKSAGYTTAAFVSNPVLDYQRHFNQGFDVYDQRKTRRERNRRAYSEREGKATTDAVLAWAEQDLDEPWFIWVHFQDPHGPYDPPDSVPRSDPPGAPKLPVLNNASGHAGIPYYQAMTGQFSFEAYAQRYLDEIAYLDPQLERLVRGLEALGRPPALIVTADHGEAFGEDDYYFAHGHSVGLDQIRVPLLYRPAAGKASTPLVETPVSLIDVAPTLLALAGVAPPAEWQGRPLPQVGPSAADGERDLFAEHGRQAAVIAHGRVYSRDRLPEEGGKHLELGFELPWLPARVAPIGPDGPNPPYRPAEIAGADADLEQELAGYLKQTRGRKGLVHKEVDAELRAQMKALGYVED
jgi:arylsulfatase A-like enzyme